MSNFIRPLTLAFALSSLLATGALADEDDVAGVPTGLPASLDVPAGEVLDFAAIGKGVQIYDCTASGNVYSWVFRAPDATLYSGDGDEDDRVIGRHFAGPTWADEHGEVVGRTVAKVASPDPKAIPWLRLVAVSHSGHGRFSHVSSIQRLYTSGGKAPADGCSADTVGAVARVEYQAHYYFYRLDSDDGDEGNQDE